MLPLQCRLRGGSGGVWKRMLLWREGPASCYRMRWDWRAALLELLTDPASEAAVRPLLGNSLLGGESQCDFIETFCRNASARSYTLKDEPAGCSPKPVGLPASS